VKTRLARDLGEEAACNLYRVMVADVIASVKGAGLPLYLFHDGPAAAGLPPGWTGAADTVFAQEGESLGERMSAAFEHSFAAGAAGVILTGSDVPGLDAGLLRSAQEAIETHDAVFVPAFDGGYCLVAFKKGSFDVRIFREIPWSTSRVLAVTTAACAAHGLSCRLLEPRQDIDTMDDLAAYCLQPSGSALATNAWLAARGLLVALR
jgi:rSAM/selenodomain-associated transferase 1